MKRRYAVVWSEGHGPSYAGSLALDPTELVLDGVSRRGPRTLSRVRYADIDSVHVGRGPRERLDRRPALIVAAGRRPELRLVSLEGPGVTGELEERLAAARLGVYAGREPAPEALSAAAHALASPCSTRSSSAAAGEPSSNGRA